MSKKKLLINYLLIEIKMKGKHCVAISCGIKTIRVYQRLDGICFGKLINIINLLLHTMNLELN